MKVLYKISLLVVALIATQTFTMDSAAGKNNHSFAQFAYQHPFFSSLVGLGTYKFINWKINPSAYSSSATKSNYALLGISEGANEIEIKKAYREKAKQYHPDRNQNSLFAQEMMKKINIAYEEAISKYNKKTNYPEFGVNSRIRREFIDIAAENEHLGLNNLSWREIIKGMAMETLRVGTKPFVKWMAAGLAVKYLAHNILMNNNVPHDHKGWLFNYEPLHKQSVCKKNENKI